MTPAQRDNILGAHSAAMARIAELEAERDRLRKAGSELLMELALHTLGGETILKDNPKVVAMRAALARIPEAKPPHE